MSLFMSTGENVTAFWFVCLFSLAHISRLYQQKSRTGALTVGFLSDSALDHKWVTELTCSEFMLENTVKKKKKKQQPPNITNTFLLNLDQTSLSCIL